MKEFPGLTHALLVTNELSAVDLASADFCQTKKNTSQGPGVINAPI